MTLAAPWWAPAKRYLLLAHPVVHLLSVTVEELQVHALLILLPPKLPQLQQGTSLLGEDAQLGGWEAKLHRAAQNSLFLMRAFRHFSVQ